MATIKSSDPSGPLRGKVEGLVYSLQPNGTTTVRSVGEQTAPSTDGEKKGQQRMKLAHAYVEGVLADPELVRPYLAEALRRKIQARQVVFADFLKDPIIAGVEAS